MNQSKRLLLLGNPNVGKTTLFNKLSGALQKTGNWPGVTIEQKKGSFSYKNESYTLLDLPGVYSLESKSIAEQIAADCLNSGEYDAVIFVANAADLYKSMHLLLQAMLLSDKPFILALNMIDMASKNSLKIDIEKLSSLLNIRVIPLIASSKKGIDNLKETVRETFLQKDLVRKESIYVKELKSKLEEYHNLTLNLHLIYPKYFTIFKILEQSESFIQSLKESNQFHVLKENLKKYTHFSKKSIEFLHFYHEKLDDLVGKVITSSSNQSKKKENKLDKIITHKYLGIPIFLLLFFGIFELVFVLSSPLTDVIGEVITGIGEMARDNLAKTPWLASLAERGIIQGVGSVLSFVPSLLLLFFLLGLMEDSGYLNRVAFLTDRLMQKIGLQGRAFFPLILGFGCNVPAILTARTLEDDKERLAVILSTPLMSCQARFPVYMLFAGAFFSSYKALIVFSLYLVGILMAILVALFFKNKRSETENASSSSFIMELPSYQVPRLKNTLFLMLNKTKMFIKKAGGIILIAAIVLWVLSYFPSHLAYASKNTFIGQIGQAIAFIFTPNGFGFWQAAVALLFGLIAKELMITALATLFVGSSELVLTKLSAMLGSYFTPLSAYSFMLMCLLYIPCFATISVIKKELGRKWAFIATSYTLILGYLVSMLFYRGLKIFV